MIWPNMYCANYAKLQLTATHARTEPVVTLSSAKPHKVVIQCKDNTESITNNQQRCFNHVGYSGRVMRIRTIQGVGPKAFVTGLDIPARNLAQARSAF